MNAGREALVAKLVRETGLEDVAVRSLLNSLSSLMTDGLNEGGFFEMPGVGRLVKDTPKGDGKGDRVLVRRFETPAPNAMASDSNGVIDSDIRRPPPTALRDDPELTNLRFPDYTSVPPANAEVFIIGDKPANPTEAARAHLAEPAKPVDDGSDGDTPI